MTSRIEKRFASLKEEGRATLVTFTMAGDPDYSTALAILNLDDRTVQLELTQGTLVIRVRRLGRNDRQPARPEARLRQRLRRRHSPGG